MILLTGGAGYIGSHTGVALATAGTPYVVLDNFCNSQPGVLARMGLLGGISPVFVQGDVRDASTLDSLFARYPISGVVHFAGLKAVGESLADPTLYYDNNVAGTVTLIRAMERAGVKRLVFSSSANVYGDPETLPLTEGSRLGPNNPYGKSKLMVEHILRDVAAAHASWRVACLRYFNPVGAHHSGLIGEDPRGVPSNLMPLLVQAALGKRAKLSIFGDDYPTVDGTGVRDFIHVMDLAEGHLAALRYLQSEHQGENYMVANLGTGQGISVLQMVQAFEQYTGHKVPHEIAPRRSGDLISSYADPSVAHQLLGWKATRGLKEMCQDTWNWQHRNPNGYAEPAH